MSAVCNLRIVALLPSLWLLSATAAPGLDWQTNQTFRSALLPVLTEGKPGFTRMAPELTGIAFSNHLADLSAGLNQVRMNGSGVALGDVDGDGWCDIYLCRLEGEGANRLYRNLGEWHFSDITETAGVACRGQYSTGAVFADVDGDGDLDLLVNGIGVGTRLFFNDGRGHFTESRQPALARPVGSMSFALADLDGDGDLDLYVADYRTNTIRSTSLAMRLVDGKRQVRPQDRDQYEITPSGRLLEYADRDGIFFNDGHGQFTPVSWTDGRFVDEDGRPLRDAHKDWGLSVMIRDFDGDGSPDIYVCNDFWTPDRLWLNDGHGRFRAAPRPMLRHTSAFSMGIDVADIDRDGRDDFIILDMLSRDPQRRQRQRGAVGQGLEDPQRLEQRPQIERNTLFWNRGDGTYAEIAQLAGVQASEWSWAVAFLDVDLDGFEDLLITTGNQFDMLDSDNAARVAAAAKRPLPERLLLSSRLEVANVAFRNRGDLTFEEVGARWGFDAVGVSHGLALGDLDNDGDLDLVINNLNAPLGLYRNDCSAPRLAVRLRGRAPNTRGVGARLLITGGPIPQSQTMICGGRYLSGDDAMRVFAAGSNTNRLAIEVIWPNGVRSTVSDARPNSVYEIQEPVQPPALAPSSSPAPVPAYFSDVSERLRHEHHDDAFDDFARQPLLSRRLDTLGPGVAWFDLDADGRDDLLIGGGRGGSLAVFHNEGSGAFRALTNAPYSALLTREQTSVLGWRATNGQGIVLAGSSNYEDGLSEGSPVFQYERGAPAPNAGLPGQPSMAGPMALADIDGDGQLDLFVGGRVIPARYPAPASSVVFRGAGSQWRIDEANSRRLRDVGLVSGAVFCDLDNDGDPDLVLACEWGPLRVWRNEGGSLTEATDALGFRNFSGWWNGVTAADFDGDGRLDIVASNWGRNSPYQVYLPDGIRAFFGDLSGQGGFEFVEAYLDPVRAKLAPWRDRKIMTRAMPRLAERFPSASDYAAASLEDLFGPRLGQTSKLQVNWLDSTVFLNRGARFEARALPLQAQFTPAFGVCAGDLDGDGAIDLILAQNFFGVEETVARYDAGRALWLRGDGAGGFTPVSSRESGLAVDGEQRGAAVGDFDSDGRLDVVITQRNAATRLFHNEHAQPSLRVRLRGPAGNPHGAGVVLRAKTSKGWGPAWEVHAGSGYWSQDSPVTLVPGAERPSHLSVRWPWRAAFELEVPAAAKEVVVDASGGLTAVR